MCSSDLDIYDLSVSNSGILDLVNDNDSMRNNVGNWHVINLKRINSNKRKLKQQQAEIDALKASLSASKKK